MENGRKQQHSLGGLRVKTPKTGSQAGSFEVQAQYRPVDVSLLLKWCETWKVTSWPVWFLFEVEILRIFVWEHNWKRPLLVGAFDAGLKYFWLRLVDCQLKESTTIIQYPPSLPCAPRNAGFSMVILTYANPQNQKRCYSVGSAGPHRFEVPVWFGFVE